MERKDIKIRGSEGKDFDCYVVMPDGNGKVPAMVLASAIHGVDKDLRAIADEFAAAGYIAVAPDLFWRSVPGPLTRDDPRSTPRGQPRHEKIKDGESDMAAALAMLKTVPRFNGKGTHEPLMQATPVHVVLEDKLGLLGAALLAARSDA